MSIFIAVNQLHMFAFLIIIQMLQNSSTVFFNSGYITSFKGILENVLK